MTLGIARTLVSLVMVSGLATAQASENQALVQKVYDFLSNPGSESHAQAFHEATSEQWRSIGNYSGKNINRLKRLSAS